MTTTISGDTGCNKVTDGSIVQAALASPFYLPSPQTWQIVTGSRVLGTTYTNNTGQPIKVSVIFNPANTSMTLVVSGIVVAYNTSTSAGATSLVAEVPAGATYKADTNATLNQWAELR